MNDSKVLRISVLLLGLLGFFLAGCTESVSRNDNPRILAMGDSLMATHSLAGRAVADSIEVSLGEQVIDRSVMGARVLYALPISGSLGMKIAKQYTTGNWDWIVLNGGGNDLWLGCGCTRCDRKTTRMISTNGQDGKIPDFVGQLRATGAQVIYVGYLRSPGLGSPIEHCRKAGDEFEARIARMASAENGVYFLSLADLVPFGDRSYHVFDMIHPSVKASTEIGRRVANIIAARPRAADPGQFPNAKPI